MFPDLMEMLACKRSLLQTVLIAFCLMCWFVKVESELEVTCYIPSEFVGSSPVLDKAVTSLSSAFFVKRDQDFGLSMYSLGLYGKALRIAHSRIRLGQKCG